MSQEFTFPKHTDPRFIDLTGRRYGRLTVIKFLGRNSKKVSRWLCQCDCGNTTAVSGTNLNSKRSPTKSCGCYIAERLSAGLFKSHGKRNTPEYKVWIKIIERCENENAENYKFYGGRGIKICQRWRNSFEAFLEDMGVRPSPKSQIDRKDSNLGYSPDNCRWVDKITQARNTRSNRREEFNGIVMCVAEWAETLGVPYYIFRNRLRNGHSIQDTIRDILQKKRDLLAKES